MHTWTQHVTDTFSADLHGGDDGGDVCAVAVVDGIWWSKQRKFHLVRLIAIDLRVGANTRVRTVQNST